jgi:hypothetical protein
MQEDNARVDRIFKEEEMEDLLVCLGKKENKGWILSASDAERQRASREEIGSWQWKPVVGLVFGRRNISCTCSRSKCACQENVYFWCQGHRTTHNLDCFPYRARQVASNCY